MEDEKNRPSLVQSLAKSAMAVWAAVALPHIEGAQAQTPVSIELVFAVDTSMSIDGFEYDLLMKGIANAFRTPEIVNLIGQHDGVAVSLFQWSSEVNAQYMIPWHLLTDPASVLSFAAKVEKAERDPNRVFTAIGEAIAFGVRLIAENAFEGTRLKIDVSAASSVRSTNAPKTILLRSGHTARSRSRNPSMSRSSSRNCERLPPGRLTFPPFSTCCWKVSREATGIAEQHACS